MYLFLESKSGRGIRITREFYEEWTSVKKGGKETTTHRRRVIMTGFAKYLVSVGHTGIYTGADDTQAVYQRFHKILDEAGIGRKADGFRPRLHDLRHTFCVRTLERMPKKGFDLYTSLPLLSKYLGHSHITDTEYYLRMVESHYKDILEKTQTYYPELYGKEDDSDD